MTDEHDKPLSVIDDAALRDLDRECRHADSMAEFKRAQAEKARQDAELAEEHARLLPAVRKFLTARMGMTLEQALAEAEAEMERAAEAVVETAQAVERAKSRVRDLEGWRRIQQELIAEKRAQLEAPSEPET